MGRSALLILVLFLAPVTLAAEQEFTWTVIGPGWHAFIFEPNGEPSRLELMAYPGDGGVIVRILVFREGIASSHATYAYEDSFGAYVSTPAGNASAIGTDPSGGRGISVGSPNEPSRITLLAYAVGDIQRRQLSLSLGPGGALLGMTSGDGGVYLRGREMGGVSAGANGIYGGAHAGALGKVEMEVQHRFFGGFGPVSTIFEPGARPLVMEDETGVRLCPCTFQDFSGPKSLGPGHATFHRNEAFASLLYAEPYVLYGVDAYLPSVE